MWWNIYPLEIENVHAEHPHVADVTIGIPDPDRGQVVTAFIEATDHDLEAVQKEFRAWCSERLARQMAADLRALEQIPSSATGEFDVAPLIAQHWPRRGSQVKRSAQPPRPRVIGCHRHRPGGS